MLNRRLSHVHDLIREASALVGSNAPRVADAIIEAAFPDTFRAAQVEGAESILRNGLISYIKPMLRAADDDGQRDFADVEKSYGHITRNLKKDAYFVPDEGVYVHLPRLISEPALLDAARRFMRQKGEECLAEAKTLDELYEAVVAP